VASWSVLSQNVSSVVTHTSLYYSSKVFFQFSSFILLLTNIRKIFTGIDSTGFKITHASQYYTERTRTRRKYAKLSIGADVLQQIICTIKIRRAPTRHDNIDFRPIITKTSEILPLSVVTADKAYDSEENHVLVRELLHGYSIIPTRYENVPIWKTHGRYRKQMKGGYSKLLYGQRNKNETIVLVIKRLFGEHITSRLVRTQNSTLCITYNIHRPTNLWLWYSVVSTERVWTSFCRTDDSDIRQLAVDFCL